MKNKIILGLATTSLLVNSAFADVYVGVEYGMASSETEQEASGYINGSVKGDNDYKDIKFKVGAGEDGGLKFQATLSLISFDVTLFDDTNSDYVEIGVDLIKEFETSPQVYPFVKVGLGAGSMSVDGYSESDINAVSVNIGAGISYKATENLYLIGGIDYIGRSWQDIEYNYSTISFTISTSDSGFKPYIGANYKF
jgi:opacity protein-like surface antigen